MKQQMVDQYEDTKQDVRDTLSPRKQMANLKQSFHDSFHSMLSPRRFRSSVGAGAVGDDVAQADDSLMQCMAQLVDGDPESFLECSMQALSLCIDLVRSMFAPSP